MIKKIEFILFFLIISCSKINIVQVALNNKSDIDKNIKIFQDKDSLLTIQLENQYEYSENIDIEKKIYTFEWYREVEMKDGKKSKEFKYSLEIQIIPSTSKFYKNVKLANYEFEFTNNCNCLINKKGWILHQNENIRIFDYKTDKFYFVSYQFNKKDYFIQINIKSINYELTLNQANIILENVKML